MTSKELLYVEDALGHETFMKSCSKIASNQLTDGSLSAYMTELEKNLILFQPDLYLRKEWW